MQEGRPTRTVAARLPKDGGEEHGEQGRAGARGMAVTGHRTRSVFDRYHIVSPADLQDVARKLAGTI